MQGKGIVIAVFDNRARVRMDSSGECEGCGARGCCSSRGPENREITVTNGVGAQVSDIVRFEAEPAKVLFSALMIWILPLAAMIVGYVVTDRFAGGAWPILAAFIFLILAFTALKTIDRVVAGGTAFYPHISRIMAHGGGNSLSGMSGGESCCGQ